MWSSEVPNLGNLLLFFWNLGLFKTDSVIKVRDTVLFQGLNAPSRKFKFSIHILMQDICQVLGYLSVFFNDVLKKSCERP